MKGNSVCEKCGNKFNWSRSKFQTIPKFCSRKCKGHTGFRPGSTLFISEMTNEQKFERLKKSFEKHVIRQEGCWSWKGPIDKGGYSVMSCRPEIGSNKGHKASWLIYHGEIPKYMYICHKCDNPICTNPDHLWIGTSKQNNDDKISKGRARYILPPHKIGSENGSSKLTEDQVKQIKMLISSGRSCYGIGKEFNVSKTTILRIKNGKNWGHVTC